MGWKESLLKAGAKMKGAGGKLKSAGGWLKKKAPAAGRAAKGAGLAGAAVGGAAVGAGLAGGAAAYSGGRWALGTGWRLSKTLFGAINILLVFTLLFHWQDVQDPAFANTRLRGIFFILVAVYAWIFIFTKHEQGMGDLKAMIPPLIISAIAIAAPLILLNPWIISITHMQEIFTAVLVFVPVWPIVVMFGMPSTRIVRVIRAFYVIFIVVAFLPSAWYAISTDFNIEPMRVGATKYIYDAGEGFVKGLGMAFTAVKSAVLGVPGKAKKLAEEQIQYAVGDDYTGQVEDSKNKPVGVYLEDVKPAATEFYADDAVVVWATLIARTMDPDKKITVTTSCYGEKKVGDELKKEKGDADPLSESDEFVIETTTEEEKYITCEFPPRFFDEGQKSIFMDAEFNFRTMSYIKAYFMNLETLRSMRREGIDPFVQYSITDTNPTSIYTTGPVALTMETSEVPIGVSTTDPVDIMLGVSVKNAWPQGMVKSVQDITIKIPESMEIVYCDHAFEKVPCAGDECEDGQYTVVYKIKKTGEGRLGLDSIKNVAGYHSIACRMRVNNIDELMGNYPIVSRYFKVSADYTYSLEASTGVTIKHAISNTTSSTPTTPAQTQAPSFSYSPSQSTITLNKGQEKVFSVSIKNPGSILYGWMSEGIMETTSPDTTSFIFSSSEPGQATVKFIAKDQDGNTIEEKTWTVNVVE